MAFDRGEKIIAAAPGAKLSPFDWESFEIGQILYSTTVRRGEFAEDAAERAQLQVEAWSDAQLEAKRAIFVTHRALTRSNEPLPEMPRTPVILTPSADESEDQDIDDDEDHAFAGKPSPDAGDRITVTYGVEHFAPIPYNSFNVGGQFYTVNVLRRETATEAYLRAWGVVKQLAERQFLRDAAKFQRVIQQQEQAKLKSRHPGLGKPNESSLLSGEYLSKGEELQIEKELQLERSRTRWK